MKVGTVRIRAAVSILLYAGVAAACDPVIPPLPRDLEFTRPALDSTATRELIGFLNAHRRGWKTSRMGHFQTPDALIEYSSQADYRVSLYFYSQWGKDTCIVRRSEAYQIFPKQVCERLESILNNGSEQ